MEQVFGYIIGLGAAVMMPIIFTILGVCIGIKFIDGDVAYGVFVDVERGVVVAGGGGLLYEEQGGADGVVGGVPTLGTADDEGVEYRLEVVVGVFAADVVGVEDFVDVLDRAGGLVAGLVVDDAYAALAGLLVGDGVESVDDAAYGEVVLLGWCT